MPTRVVVDGHLLDEAMRAGRRGTKKATVMEALEEYIRRRKQALITTLFGKVEFDRRFDYKKSAGVRERIDGKRMRRAVYILGGALVVLAALVFLVQYPSYRRAKEAVRELRAREATRDGSLDL